MGKKLENKEKVEKDNYSWLIFFSMIAIVLLVFENIWYVFFTVILIVFSVIHFVSKINFKNFFIFIFILTLSIFGIMYSRNLQESPEAVQTAAPPKPVLEVPIELSMMFNYISDEWDIPMPLDNATLVILKDGTEIDRAPIINGRATLNSPLTNGRTYDFVSFKEGFYPLFGNIYLGYDLKPTVNVKGGLFGDANANIDWDITALNYTLDEIFLMKKIGSIGIMIDYMIIDTIYELNMSDGVAFLELGIKKQGIVSDTYLIFILSNTSASPYEFFIEGREHISLYRPEIIHINKIIGVKILTSLCVEKDLLVYADDDDFWWEDLIRTERNFEKFDMVFESMKPNILTIKLVC